MTKFTKEMFFKEIGSIDCLQSIPSFYSMCELKRAELKDILKQFGLNTKSRKNYILMKRITEFLERLAYQQKKEHLIEKFCYFWHEGYYVKISTTGSGNKYVDTYFYQNLTDLERDIPCDVDFRYYENPATALNEATVKAISDIDRKIFSNLSYAQKLARHMAWEVIVD